MRIFRFVRKLKNSKKARMLERYAEIGNSINRGISIRLDKPQDRKYLFIGDDSIVGGNFIFESEAGKITIGNHSYVGGGYFYQSLEHRDWRQRDHSLGWNNV